MAIFYSVVPQNYISRNCWSNEAKTHITFFPYPNLQTPRPPKRWLAVFLTLKDVRRSKTLPWGVPPWLQANPCAGGRACRKTGGEKPARSRLLHVLESWDVFWLAERKLRGHKLQQVAHMWPLAFHSEENSHCQESAVVNAEEELFIALL